MHIGDERNHWHSGEKSWHASYAIKHYTVHDFHTPKGVVVKKKTNERMNEKKTWQSKCGAFTFSWPKTCHGVSRKKNISEIIYENFMVYIFFVVHMIVAAIPLLNIEWCVAIILLL